MLTVEQFNALPKNEKKILIAQDVLDNLKSRKYIAYSGVYINDLDVEGVSGKDDIRENFDKIQSCSVCALGSCLLSTTKFKNQLKFKDIGYTIRNKDTKVSSDTKVWNILKDIFEPKELKLMEMCFEKGAYGISLVAEDIFEEERTLNDKDLGSDYGKAFQSSHERLKTIMNNIITNKGTFTPSQDI